MLKTPIDIERDFYLKLKQSQLGQAVTGDVYYDECRPVKSRKEDIVLAFLAGNDTQIQRIVVIVNIFVSDIKLEAGRNAPNRPRIAELMTLANQFIHDQASDDDYCVEAGPTPTTTRIEEIGQHSINIRLNIKRFS